MIANSFFSAHRQRTQGYITALENEILRLRERESQLTKENLDFKDYIDLLRQSLVENSISIPEPPPNLMIESPNKPIAPSGLAEEPHPAVVVDLAELQTIEAERWCSTQAAENQTRNYEPPETGLSSIDSTSERPNITVQQLNTQTGINFILE